MKLLKITTFYPAYLKEFYGNRPCLADLSFAEQKAALDHDAFGWTDYWSEALTPLGYQVMEVTMNASSLQRAWAREHALVEWERMDLKEIAVAQVVRFKPDVLWFDDPDGDLLLEMRRACPSIRLVLGWSGSAIANTDTWRHTDLILSCAPEAVEQFQRSGFKAAHLDHGFDARINGRLLERPKQVNFSFVGQLVRSGDFHLQRDLMLEQLATHTGISIYSPSASFTLKDELATFLMAGLYDGLRLLRRGGFSKQFLSRLPVIGKATAWKTRPTRPVNPRLKSLIRPAVFGLDMFQVLRDSHLVLNIHADSSPRYASNMRLFETTGVGSCLVTDWKSNLSSLFEPDTEVVVYKSTQECVEKVKWLLDHPAERAAIAKAGQQRTLCEHTFSHRALQLDELLRKAMRS